MQRAQVRRALAGIVVSAVLGALQPPAEAAPSPTTEYARAYRIGLEAYTYGLPLVTMYRTFRTMTSTDVAQGAYGPVNAFHHVRGTNTATSGAVVTPGATGLSSIAWLDLTDGPQVLHVPVVTGHTYVLGFIDPYTTNVVNLGSAMGTAPGDYVIRDPQHRRVAIPAGMHALDVDYSRMWIIGSTQLLGAADLDAVHAIQDGYTLAALRDVLAGT